MHNALQFMLPYVICFDILVLHFFLGVNATEIEDLRAKKEGLEESIAEVEQSCKTIYMELRNLENEAADLHKKRVGFIEVEIFFTVLGGWYFFSYWNYACLYL